MNVVEAIDLWIDENIESMDDAEVDHALQVLDVIGAHELSEFNPHHLRDHEFDLMIGLFDGSERQPLAVTMVTGGMQIAGRDYVWPGPEEPAGAEPAGKVPASEKPASEEPTSEEPTSADAIASSDGDPALAPAPSDIPHDKQLSTPTSGVDWKQLTESDELAPRFLGSNDIAPAPVRNKKAARAIITLTLVGALVAFGLGAWSLFSTLDPEVPQEVTATSSAEATPAPPAVAATQPAASSTKATEQLDSDTGPLLEDPDPTADQTESETEAAPKTARLLTAVIIDETGSVYAAPATDAPINEMTLIYDPADDDLPALSGVRPWGNRVAAISEKGSVRLIDPTGEAEPALLWNTGTLAGALDVALVNGTNVILTSDGDVVSFDGDTPPTDDSLETLWDQGEITTLATNGSALVALTQSGDAMLWSTLQNDPQRIWAAEGEPLATAAQLTTSEIIIGLDGGQLRRHQLDPIDNTGKTLWAGAASAKPWALQFSATDDQTAIVLDSYEVIVVDNNDSRTVVWDGSDGLPAPIDVAFVDGTLIVLLDTGSVVELSTADAAERSIWDISEGTLEPAVKLLLLRSESSN